MLRPRTEADITDLSRPENRYERGEGKLLEVYRPVWTPGGTPLLFETYFRYDTVSQRSQQLWRGFAGVMLSSLLALLLLLGAGGWLLAARARRAGARHEELMRRALDASDAERRRIAATLHDGVVQQLAAASFIAARQAQRAAGQEATLRLATDLDTVASAVRDGIAGLRSLLVDIYPPSLHTPAWPARCATSPMPRPAAPDRSRPSAPTWTPGSRTACRNTSRKRCSASPRRRYATPCGTAAPGTSRCAWRRGTASPALEIADDGDGFDAAALAEEGTDGHFGLRLMAEAARVGGGWLGLLSAPGAGTLVRYEAAAR